jgi:hypothetical protein
MGTISRRKYWQTQLKGIMVYNLDDYFLKPNIPIKNLSDFEKWHA